MKDNYFIMYKKKNYNYNKGNKNNISIIMKVTQLSRIIIMRIINNIIITIKVMRKNNRIIMMVNVLIIINHYNDDKYINNSVSNNLYTTIYNLDF